MALYTTQIRFGVGHLSQGGEPGYIFSDGWLGPSDLGLIGYVVRPNATKSDQTLQVKFSGIHIVIYGGGYPFKYTIDDAPQQTATPESTNWDRVDKFIFNSTILEDGNHTLTMSDFTGNTSVYEAYIRPGPDTPLNSKTLFQVDDTDPSIVYEGNWEHLYPGTYSTRHNSHNIGDSLFFGFCGSYVAIIGGFDWSQPGLVTIGVSMDNQALKLVTKTSGQKDNFDGLTFYETRLPTTGDCQHRINVTVMNVTGVQNFTFQYLYYTPSFATFGEAPNVTALPPPSATSDMPSANGSSHKSSSVVGPAVGGAIGGVVLIAAIVLAFLFFRRKRKTNTTPTPYIAPAAQDQVKEHHRGGLSRFSALPEIQAETAYSPYGQNSGVVYDGPPPVRRQAQPTIFAPSAQKIVNKDELSYMPPEPQ